MPAPTNIDPMTVIILASATLIIAFVLCAKFIKGLLKVAVISVMLICIIYFLRQVGLL